MLRSLNLDLAEWVKGKNPWVRLPVLIWGFYAFKHQWFDPDYRTFMWGLNFGIHELGHMIWQPFGMTLAILGGSLTQCLTPIICSYMFWRQKDIFAISFCFFWLSVNLFDVAAYVADATDQAMPLLSPFGSDAIHDWHYLLNHWGLLAQDQFFGSCLRGLAHLSMFIFITTGTLIVHLIWRERHANA